MVKHRYNFILPHNQNQVYMYKDKASLCLTKYYVMKTYGGVEVKLHAFLTSVLDGGEWSASRPGRFIPRERSPGSRWIGSWVDSRAVLPSAGTILSVDNTAEGVSEWTAARVLGAPVTFRNFIHHFTV
jgi:hypothetical protein